ncbi:hypothetical protein VNO80_03786 [Phaseolus coccineus]|uniref:Leishmanolysin-like peptidase n=1 Tax=Phaseolus coccineus TaxID=3886 RepID=A0AAN9RNW1_PHACN
MDSMVRCHSLRAIRISLQPTIRRRCFRAPRTPILLGRFGGRSENIASHSCILDQMLEQRKRPGRKVHSVTPQVYKPGLSKHLQLKGRALLGISTPSKLLGIEKQPIRIYLNYDAVGLSPDRDCQKIGDIVKLEEPPMTYLPGLPSCNPLADPPVFGDCWYNCTSEDISGEDKKIAFISEFMKMTLCSPSPEGVSDADLVLLVTTRPTTGNTLAWAAACECDQWDRAIAGHVNVAPRHLTVEADTLLSATLIHEVMHVLGFDPHAFAHFRDERRRRCDKVSEQVMDEKIGRMVTCVVLPRVVMHSRHHYVAFSGNFAGLELEDGGDVAHQGFTGKRGF